MINWLFNDKKQDILSHLQIELGFQTEKHKHSKHEPKVKASPMQIERETRDYDKWDNSRNITGTR